MTAKPSRTAGLQDGPDTPSLYPFVIVPHATNKLPRITKAIRAPSDGVIALVRLEDQVTVLHPVLAGERIDVRVDQVLAIGTTVTGTIIGYA